MNDHVDPGIAALLHRYWPIPRDVDHFEREEALREKARERRLMAHPDPTDPDHPDDDE